MPRYSRIITVELTLLAWLFGAGFVAPACGAELLPETTAAEFARIFPPEAGGWSAAPHGYGGAATGEWTYAPAAKAEWSDYAAEFDFTLIKPAARRDGLELGAFTRYHAMANLGGYEAAALIRYESQARHYRIAVSSLWKEIIVWRPTGGVVQVSAFPFELNATYRLRVECRGPRLTIRINGKDAIDWWDRADPVLKGGVGIARKEGEAYFIRAKVETLAAANAAPPMHAPKFREQEWHGERWFFDHQEPVFVLTKTNILDHMRLVPGYRPGLYTFNYATDWSQFYPSRITACKTVEAGERLILETSAVDPEKKNSITSHARLVVTYDSQQGLYHYDHTCRTQIDNPADAAKVANSWDHGDAVFLGCVGTAQTRDPQAYKPLFNWAVFQAADGKHYKVPFNPNFHYLGRSSTNGGPLRPDGGFVMAMGDPVLNPVIRIPGLTADATDIHTGLCWWAFDVHTLFTPKTTAGKLAVGSYTTRVTYTAMKPAEAQRLFAQAEFYQPGDLSVEIPVFTAGIGFTEPFDKTVLLASAHSEHRIWAGVLDKTIGRGDKSSLRVDAATEAWTLSGPSYFTSAYAKKIVVTAWVKTQDVSGEGPAIGFRRMDNNGGEFHCTGLTGTRDWTQVRFSTSFPADVFGAQIYFRNSGGGTVWFDDFKIEVLDEKATTDAPAARVYPLNPPNADMVLNWNGKGNGACVLDESGYGHHGRIYGQGAWAEADGKRALVFDGKTTYAWPLSTPNLALGPPATLQLELKPESEGFLLACGFQFTYRIAGGPDQFGIVYEPSGGKPVASKPFLKANTWQHLALVVAADKIGIYHNGSLVEELPVAPRAFNWSQHSHSTWHRHPTLFGMGPGDMTLSRDESAYHWKGQLRSFRVFRKTLTPQEITAGAGR